MADRSVTVRLRAEVAGFKAEMASAAKAAEQVGKSSETAARQADTSLGRMVQSATRNQAAWTTAGTALVAFGAVTTAALVGSVKAAIDWESAWAGVAKTVSGTPAQLAAVEDGLRGLARTLPSTHAEIAAVAEAAGQLGVATGDIVGFTRVMIDLGETTNLTADEAATSIAQLMNIMGTAPADVDRLGAALVALGNNGASTERDIIQMSQRIAAAGKIVGLTEADVMGFANAISSVGIDVEAGGTAISRVMTDIAKAVSTGSEDLSRFATVAGMSAEQFTVAFRDDPAQAIVAFVEGLGRIQAAGGDVFTTLSDLGQADVRVSAALLSMANAGDLLRESLDLGAQAWSDNSALAEEAAKRYDTTAAKVEIARNNLRDAGISIGESVTPAVAGLADAVADVAGWFTQLPGPVQGTLGALGGLAGVTSLAAGGFLLLFPRVVETVSALRALRTIAPGAVTALGRVGKAAGIAAAAVAVLATAGQLQSGAVLVPGVGEATKALLDLADAAPGASAAIDALFAGRGGASDIFWGNNVRDIEEAVALLTAPDFGMRVDDVASRILSLGQNSSTAAEQARSSFEAIDTALANMVASGNADEAAAAVDALGLSASEVEALLPGYGDALATAASQQQLAGETASTAAAGFAEMTEAQTALKDAAAGTAAAFVDPIGAYEELAAAAEDGAVSLDAWLTKIEEQAAALASWESNMIAISGRVSEGVLTKLAEMGPAGAQIVADLAGLTEEEWAAQGPRIEAAFAGGGESAAAAFGDALVRDQQVIQAAAAQLGTDAATEIATALAAGTTTVEQVIADYGLVIEGYVPVVTVTAETEQAVADLGTVIEVAYTTGQQTPVITVTQDGVSQTVADLDTAIAIAQETDGQAPIVTVTTDGVPQSLGELGSVTAAALGVPPSTLTTTGTAGTSTAIGALNSVRDSVFGIPSTKTISITVATKYVGAAIPKGAEGGLVTAGAIVRGYAAGGRVVPGSAPSDPRADNVLASGPGGLFALRSGEFVSTENATRRNYAALVAANRGGTLIVASRAAGGGVGYSAAGGGAGWSMAGDVGREVARALSGARFDIDADRLTGNLVARIRLQNDRRAGVR